MTIRSLTASILLAGGLLLTLDTAARSDTAADEQTIRGLDQKWLGAVQAGDAAASAGFYAPDGSLLPAGGPIAQGTAAITAVWQGIFGMKNAKLTFTPTQVTVASAGDMAYEIGTYELSFDSDTGPAKDVGKYVVVWKKIGGDWKVATDIFNSDGAKK
jgi:uncharacterized protein (TIGR02246 family)